MAKMRFLKAQLNGKKGNCFRVYDVDLYFRRDVRPVMLSHSFSGMEEEAASHRALLSFLLLYRNT